MHPVLLLLRSRQREDDRLVSGRVVQGNFALFAGFAKEVLVGGFSKVRSERLAVDRDDLVARFQAGMVGGRTRVHGGDEGFICGLGVQLEAGSAQVTNFDVTLGLKFTGADGQSKRCGGTCAHAGNKLIFPIDERLDDDHESRHFGPGRSGLGCSSVADRNDSSGAAHSKLQRLSARAKTSLDGQLSRRAVRGFAVNGGDCISHGEPCLRGR